MNIFWTQVQSFVFANLFNFCSKYNLLHRRNAFQSQLILPLQLWESEQIRTHLPHFQTLWPPCRVHWTISPLFCCSFLKKIIIVDVTLNKRYHEFITWRALCISQQGLSLEESAFDRKTPSREERWISSQIMLFFYKVLKQFNQNLRPCLKPTQ